MSDIDIYGNNAVERETLGDRGEKGQKSEAMVSGRPEGWRSVHRQRRQADLGVPLTSGQYRKGG